ncbi:hypothetical protein NBRC116188_11820 [Oceaniserpentilla sp. 4NH20-0058]
MYASSVYYWFEPTGKQYTVDEVRDDASWEKLDGELNFGYTKKPLWFMQNLKVFRKGEWILQLGFQLIDYVDLYVYVEGELSQELHTGDALPYGNRPYKVPYFLLEIENEKPESIVVIGRLQSSGVMLMPIKWWDKEKFVEHLLIEHNVFSAFYAVLIIMTIYHLFVFLVTREKSYLYFVLSVASYILLRIAFDGRGFAWLWPNLPEINNYIFHTFYLLYQVAILTFISTFLELKNSSKWLYKISILFRAISIVLLIGNFFLEYSFTSPIILFFGSMVLVYGIFSGSYLWYRGNKGARFFTLAWAVFLFGFLMVNLRGFGVFDTSWFINYVVLVGSLLQVLLFAFSLADRIQVINHQKLTAEKALVKSKDDHLQVLKRFQNLYENSPIGNFQSDNKFRLTSVNKACSQVFGFEDQREMLSTFTDIREYLESPYEEFQGMVRKATLSQASIDNELLIKNAQGELRWISVNLNYISSDVQMGYEGTVQDITERKQADMLKAELDQERLKVMEQFSLGIAKEISIPLGSNVATTSFMREGLDDLVELEKQSKLSKDDYQNYFDLVRSSLGLVSSNQKRITRVVKRFREVSSWHQNLKLSHVEVLSELENVVNSQRWRMAGWRVDINCDPELNIYTYQQAINSIIIQLIDNALVHSQADKESSPIITISVTKDKQDNINILFVDNGIGIKKELVKNLCKPFFTTDKGYDGHIGLGLYMIYNLVCIAFKGRIFFPVSGEGFAIQMVIPAHLE